jgi:hypothetical protein
MTIETSCFSHVAGLLTVPLWLTDNSRIAVILAQWDDLDDYKDSDQNNYNDRNDFFPTVMHMVISLWLLTFFTQEVHISGSIG